MPGPLLCVALLLAACGGTQSPEGPPFSRLPEAGAASGSQVLLTVADVEELRALLAESGAEGVTEGFLSAEIDLIEGQFDRAFHRFGDVLHQDPNSLAGILAAERLGSLGPVVGRFAEQGEAVLAPIAGQVLNPLAAFYVNRFRLEVRRAAYDHVTPETSGPFSAEDIGLPDEWRVAGPFGRLPRLDLDRAEPFDGDLVLADVYAPEGRHVPVRVLRSRGTAFTLGMVTGGTWVLETWAHLDAASNRVAALEVPVGAILDIDGTVVFERRDTGAYQSTTLLRPVQLSAGWHRIRLRLGWLGLDDDIRFRLIPLAESEPGLTFHAEPPAGAVPGTALAGRTSGSALADLLPASVLEPAGALEALALMQLAADFRDDRLGERALTWFDDQPAVSPIVSVWRARLAGGLMTISPSEQQNRRLQYMREALAAAPSADGALLPMLAVLVSDGREEEALRLARGVAERLASEPAAQLALYDLYQRRGWDELAETTLARALELDPSNCDIAVSLLELYAYRDHYPALDDLPPAFASCEAALIERLIREDVPAGDVEAAEATLRTLQARRPDDGTLVRQLFDLAMWRGDWEGAGSVLQTADEAALPPLDRAVLEVDWQLSRGLNDQALETIRTALAAESPGDYQLHRMAALLRQEPLLADLRVDTEDAIAAYRARGEMLRAPAIYALDYGAFRYFEDGSAMSIVHQILHIRTRDALATYGEVSVPHAAILLRARTIKADGTILEPDNIPGKETISMPNLEVGDFVEYEYLELIGPSRVRGDTLLGPRFYFQVADAPLTHSEMVVEVPEGWSELAIDRWAGGPEPEVSVVGDFRRYRFIVENSPQLVDEPGSPPLDETLPSVRVAHAYTWHDVRDYFIDQRLAVVRPTPEIAVLAEQLTADADEPRDAVHRIFRWVVDEVRETGGFLSSDAIWTLRQGEGERLPLLLALLEAAGFEADLVFLRSWEEPQIESQIPDSDQYPHTAVRVRGEDDLEVWLDPAPDHAIFDYVLPHIQGAPGLVVADRRTAEIAWVEAPRWPDDAQRHRIELTMTLDEQGGISAESVERVSLPSAAGTRQYLEQVQDERSLIQDLEAGLSGSFSGVAVTEVGVEGEEDPDAPLVLSYQFRASALARPEGEGLRIDTRIFDRQLRAQLGSQATRIYPLSVGYPFSEELRLTFRLPDGYRFRDVPAPVSVTTDLLDYSWTVEAGGADSQFVTLVRRTELRVGRVTPEAYPELLSALEQIDRAEALHMGASRSE